MIRYEFTKNRLDLQEYYTLRSGRYKKHLALNCPEFWQNRWRHEGTVPGYIEEGKRFEAYAAGVIIREPKFS